MTHAISSSLIRAFLPDLALLLAAMFLLGCGKNHPPEAGQGDQKSNTTSARDSNGIEELGPGHEIFAARQKGDIKGAEKLLREWVELSCKYSLRPISPNEKSIGIEERLSLGCTANVCAHYLELQRKGTTKVSPEVLKAMLSLIASIDTVLENTKPFIKDNRRMQQQVKYTIEQKKRLLAQLREVTKVQGMTELVDKVTD